MCGRRARRILICVPPPFYPAPPHARAHARPTRESPDVPGKIEALKTVILMILNGEQLSKLLMTVIRFCLTIEDHRLKKVLSLYWEVVAKYDAAGKLLPEMILVCNALRNDLNHPNEYVRGCTLRFLCKVKELDW